MKTVDQRVSEINDAVNDIADYLCSRGDTIPLRAQIEGRARTILHALAAKGWTVEKKST